MGDNRPFRSSLGPQSCPYYATLIIPPTAIPHTTTEEDTYMGYHIPKGAIVIPNTW